MSVYSASFDIAVLANFATGIAWINPAVFVGMAALCALVAIVSGHMGSFRGHRLAGDGRSPALFGLLLGWLLIIVCLLATMAALGLIAGLALLTDAANSK